MEFSHFDEDGNAVMVDVSGKEITQRRALAEGKIDPIQGRLLLKQDSHLAVAGSVKARGGIYEVLKHTEDLALEAGLITLEDDYSKLATDESREFIFGIGVRADSISPFRSAVSGKHFIIKGAKRKSLASASSMSSIDMPRLSFASLHGLHFGFTHPTSSACAICFTTGISIYFLSIPLPPFKKGTGNSGPLSFKSPIPIIFYRNIYFNINNTASTYISMLIDPAPT